MEKKAKRKGGRKKLPAIEKKKPFYLYISEKKIKLLGGKKVLKRLLENYIDSIAFAEGGKINFGKKK